MLNLQLEGDGLSLWARDCLYRGIHKPVADQSHGLSMTPVSIEQLKITLRQ